MMKARLTALFRTEEEYEILSTFKGSTLQGRKYEPIFPYFKEYKSRGAFRVLCDKYVTEESGTGVVHQVDERKQTMYALTERSDCGPNFFPASQAPYFGEDDNRVCLANGVITRDMVGPNLIVNLYRAAYNVSFHHAL